MQHTAREGERDHLSRGIWPHEDERAASTQPPLRVMLRHGTSRERALPKGGSTATLTAFVSLLVLTLPPCILLAGGYALLVRAQARRPERFASILGRSLIVSAALTIVFDVWTTVAILNSSSSTAVIAFIFLPIYSVAAALLGFAAAWSLLTLVEAARGRGPGPGRTEGIGAALLLAALTTAGAFAWWRHAWLADAASTQTPPARLTQIASQAFALSDLEVLERLAAKPALSADLAEALAHECQMDLPPGKPGRCYSIFVGLAGSAAADPELLAKLANFSDLTIRSRVAQNPRTPTAIAEVLANDSESMVRMWVAMHPGLSHETLERLARDADPMVSRYAAAVLRRSGR